MRRRIVLTTVLVSVITLFLFVTLVAWVSAARIVDTQGDSARIDANRIAVGIDDRLDRGESIAPEDLVGFTRSDESAEIRLANGDVVLLGTPADNQRITVRSDADVPVVVEVNAAGDNLVTAAMRIGGVLSLLSLLAVGGATLAARRLGDSLVEPLRDLSLVAARLGSGDPRPARRRYGVTELDAVAEVLDISAQRIGEQLSTERRLAGDVSHQLRTPLTALSMRLEEVIATDDPDVARSEAGIALQQVERLSGVVDDLLSFTRHPRATQSAVEVDPVLFAQMEEWRGAYASAGRGLRVRGQRGLSVWVSAGAFSQVIATLIENALVHGDGTTTVRTRTTGSSVVVEVADQGAGVPQGLARRIFDRDVSGASRSGLGLAVARALTEVEGGRLELIQPHPATFAVFLPIVVEEPAAGAVPGELGPGGPSASGPSADGSAPRRDRADARDQGAGVSGSTASGGFAGSRGNTNRR